MKNRITFDALGLKNERIILTHHRLTERDAELHDHDFVEIAYIHSGSGFHEISDFRYPVKSGDICVINIEKDHKLICSDPDIPLIVTNCIIREKDLQNLLTMFPGESNETGTVLEDLFKRGHYSSVEDLKLKERGNPASETIIHAMLDEFSLKKPGYEVNLSAHLLSLLISIARVYLAPDDSVDESREKIFRKAKGFLELNYNSEGLTIKETARFCSVSDRYLEKIFSSKYGSSPLSMLQDIRLREARKLIVDTNMSIRDISIECGYMDASFFYRKFKKKYGVTPGELRKPVRK